MASLPLVWNYGISFSQKKLNLCGGNSQLFGRHRTLSYSLSNNYLSSVSSPFLLSNFSHKHRRRLLCYSKFKLGFNEKIYIDTQLDNGRNNAKKRKFSLRLRPRIRLLLRRLKRASIKSMLDGLVVFFRKNVKRVTFSTSISVVLGLCFLLLKITAMPTPKVVPYSDLIMSIQNGSVEKVLFEEGTRSIYYNSKLPNDKDSESAMDKSSGNGGSVSENDVEKGISGDNMEEGKNMLVKPTKSQGASPLWEFSTRKIDHDESYLLSLMRERGISYGSAPQSVLTSMRSILITVLTLWIPLTPLMWLAYRQFSAGNSPAKKRRPSNQLFSFEDVEGVDAAKVELMEVSCLLYVIGSRNLKFHSVNLPFKLFMLNDNDYKPVFVKILAVSSLF